MSLSLNRYRDYFDPSSKEGIALINNAIYNFQCPLEGADKISLQSKDAQKLHDTVLRLATQFGYDFMIKNMPTTRVVTPGANPGDPPVITFGNRINLLETYAANNIERCRRNATIIWNDSSFVEQQPQVLRALTQANGELTNHNPPRLTDAGKDVMRDRIQSKIMAHHLLEILSPSARQAVELQSKLYTWKSADGREEEMDGLTVLAVIYSRVRPHYKIDMFSEIEKVKKIALSQFGNDVAQYFDAVKNQKILIDQKDPMAYTDEAFVRDIFKQLRQAPVESFRLEYERTETQWLMGKVVIDSASLMDEATLYYTNLKEAGDWKAEHGDKEQIIALSTQLKQLTEQLNSMKAGKPSGNPEVKKESSNTGKFEEWRLTKVDNKEEHHMVERDGKKWYWCDEHYRDNKKCGMYCTHTPGEGHIKWQERKNGWKKAQKSDNVTGAATSTPAPANAPKPTAPSAASSDSKLALSKSLQAALLTTAGLTQDQFQKIWDDACNASGN